MNNLNAWGAPNDWEALHTAAGDGDMMAVQLLLNSGVPVDVFYAPALPPYPRRAIHEAAMGGHIEALQVLINNGASIDVVDLEGSMNAEPPLQAAVSCGQAAAVKLLLDHGAAWANTDDYTGAHLVGLAVEGGSMDLALMLLARGAQVPWGDGYFVNLRELELHELDWVMSNAKALTTAVVEAWRAAEEAASSTHQGLQTLILGTAGEVRRKQQQSQILDQALAEKQQAVAASQQQLLALQERVAAEERRLQLLREQGARLADDVGGAAADDVSIEKRTKR